MSQLRPWEDTLIIALRDYQWRAQLLRVLEKDWDRLRASECFDKTVVEEWAVHNLLPPAFVKLDGRAEERIGDLLVQSQSRFFVFEAKADASCFRTEWKRKGRFRPKHVYLRVKDLLAAPEAGLLDFCLAGHFFVYWNAKSERRAGRMQVRKAEVSCTPYVVGAAQSYGLVDQITHDLMRLRRDQYTFAREGKTDASFDEVVRGKATLQVKVSKGLFQPIEREIGLTLGELSAYLSHLCGGEQGGGSEDIRMVIMAADGSFFRLLTDTKQLAMFHDDLREVLRSHSTIPSMRS